MTCGILTIGTELTRGELRDKNAGDLAEKLTDMGHSVTEICTVDDEDDRIVASLRRLAHGRSFVVCTGGLGPTTDDRTSACAARAAGVLLERNAEAHRHLVASMQARGRAVTPSSEKQADFPSGARVLPNPRGTAPGFSVMIDDCRFYFMPGVPAEMERMFDVEIAPHLPPPPATTHCRRLRTFGMPEVEINDRLQGIAEEFQVTLGYRASHSDIEVKVLARAGVDEDLSKGTERAEQALSEVERRLGPAAYGRGATSLPQAMGDLLRAKGLTLGVAESCTGGLVSQLITAVPGSSAYFSGGVCSYANAVKMGTLGVTAAALEDHGAVSEVVARQMAEGARNILGVDVALSSTGIAGPSGGTDKKPVGLVHFAVATADGTKATSFVFRGTREQIRKRAALYGLWQVRAAVLLD